MQFTVQCIARVCYTGIATFFLLILWPDKIQLKFIPPKWNSECATVGDVKTGNHFDGDEEFGTRSKHIRFRQQYSLIKPRDFEQKTVVTLTDFSDYITVRAWATRTPNFIVMHEIYRGLKHNLTVFNGIWWGKIALADLYKVPLVQKRSNLCLPYFLE